MVGADVVDIPSGRSWMGSTDFYAEEGPVREVKASTFRIVG
jgi:hypothetical protein